MELIADISYNPRRSNTDFQTVRVSPIDTNTNCHNETSTISTPPTISHTSSARISSPTPFTIVKHKLNSIVILLYLSYTLNIYVLWTNCMIFAVAVKTFDSNRSKLYDLLSQPIVEASSENGTRFNIDDDRSSNHRSNTGVVNSQYGMVHHRTGHSKNSKRSKKGDHVGSKLMSYDQRPHFLDNLFNVTRASPSTALAIVDRSNTQSGFSISPNGSDASLRRRKHDCKSSRSRQKGHGGCGKNTVELVSKKLLHAIEKQNLQRQLRHKRESNKHVIRNAIFRIIKRNVNNFTRNLLNNSTMNNVTLLRSSSEKPLPVSTATNTPIISSSTESHLTTPMIQHRTASIQSVQQLTTTNSSKMESSASQLTTTSIVSDTKNITIGLTLATNDKFNSIRSSPSNGARSSRRPFIVHQSNHFKVNNVFEMAFKLKHNKTNNERSKESNRPATGASGKGIVSLLGLFELSTRNGLRPEGHSELAAAQMAVRHINQRGLLPGYMLQLITNDTMCDPGVGVDRFFHALYTQHLTRMLMLLGSACSEVTESLAKVVPYWNIVQVSFGSTSPALSDRREFPLFYRTVAPDSSHNPARIAFIRRFGWDTVTTFSQNEEIHSLAVNDLVTELESANISCAATITFGESDFKNQLKMLRDLDTRIIIGSFSHDLAPKIFCEAYKMGMYGADYAWILHEIVGPPWWKEGTVDCYQKQLEEASENLLVVSSHNSIVGGAISYSGLTNSMFAEELASLNLPQPLSRYAPQTYDAVWAIALALRGAEERWQNQNDSVQAKLDGFDYTRYDMALEFLQQFSRLNFLGVSGPVSFSGADRIGTSAFNQVQNGELRSVALFYPSQMHLDFECPDCVPIKWKSGQVPIAKRVFKVRVATIAPAAFYTITSISSVGITMSIGFLAFNLHFRKLKAIKLSSPKLSNITAVGCMLVYAAVILLGLDHSTLPANDNAFPAVCTARVYLLSSGFSLAFGSMFAKTYRVHRIFTHSGGGVCKDKMLQDTQLISLVCALLLLDGLVVTMWVVADPMERHLSNLTLEISLTDRSVVYQPQVEVCRSQHTQTWLGALYVYKGLLLVVGVYMAWETRHVQISALNDSQYIGVSVYSVVITSAIVVVLANLIAERVTLAFITITALILISTTATLCLLFLPKMNDIWGKGVITDPVIHSMGLKMECNTRRFVTDDKRELQYRVEVQNRVYKKEMAALDAEITKLEKMLENSSSTSSSNLSIPLPIRHELAVVNEYDGEPFNAKHSKPRTPSIGGGLPLLLLSVLPPVIPRASWPSAEHMTMTMRKSVTFSSEPQLEDSSGSGIVRLPAIDLLNLRLTHQQATAEARKGLLDRIIGIFGSRPPSRKASTTSSIAGGSSGIAAALKAHMGLFSNLVPSTGTSSCNAINTSGIKPLRKSSMAKSGNAINSIASSIAEGMQYRGRIKHSYPAFIISDENNSNTSLTDVPRRNIYVDVEHEQRVNFQLPDNRRSSICHQNAQLTLRERIKGSPRFPHRILPTSSLNALEDSQKASTSFQNGSDQEHPHGAVIKPKWKSMEDSTLASSSATVTLTNLKSALKQPLPLPTTLPSGDETTSILTAIAPVDDDAATVSPNRSDLETIEAPIQMTSSNQHSSTTVPDNNIQIESIIHYEAHPVPLDETASSMESPPIDL